MRKTLRKVCLSYHSHRVHVIYHVLMTMLLYNVLDRNKLSRKFHDYIWYFECHICIKVENSRKF